MELEIIGPVATARRASTRARVLPRGEMLATVAIGLIGLVVRVHHLVTFDGPHRGSDFGAYQEAIKWIADHHILFDASVRLQVSHYPPLWFALGALFRVLFHDSARSMAGVAVAGWVVRQYLLARMLAEALPRARASRLIALALHAVLPLSVLMDGKANPEGLHATFYFASIYMLWRLEREACASPTTPSLRTAALLGALAAAALLTKSTALVLVPLVAAVYAYRALRIAPRFGARGVWRAVGVPALVSAAAWLMVAGWWCAANVARFGTPLPHDYARRIATLAVENPSLRESWTYRRALGWFLPVDLGFVNKPFASTTDVPAPNFWTPTLAGTFSDYLNRGLCRLHGGRPVRDVWDGIGSPVSERCFELQRIKVLAGLPLVLAVVSACAFLLVRTARKRKADGSLALVAGAALPVVFAMVFAVTYPLDKYSVVKANYVLASVAPLVACLGLALARRETHAGRAGFPHTAVAMCTFVIGAVVVIERGWRA